MVDQATFHEKQYPTSEPSTFTPSGWLTLDPLLFTMPKPLGEFVIVNELVHLLAPNHGKLFKLFMHAYLPDWEERERQLQAYAATKGS